MTWNYRVVHHKYVHENYTSEELAIHEAYYDKKGRVDSITEKAVDVSGQTLGEVRLTLRLMRKALDKPILDYDKIGAKARARRKKKGSRKGRDHVTTRRTDATG